MQLLENNDTYKQDNQLYHYTSIEKFNDILKTETLKATSIYMMNDPNELMLGYESLQYLMFRSIALDNSFVRQFNDIYSFPAFAFCLTELEDDMYSWDKYGNRHHGIRIGFTPSEIINYWKEIEGIDVFLVPVIYQKHDRSYTGQYSDYFNIFIKDFITEIRLHIEEKPISDNEKNELSYISALLASMIKSEEWSIEQEWRILITTGGHVHEAIKGNIINGFPTVSIEKKGENTLGLFVNNKGLASKDILKIGSLAGNREYIEYVIKLLFKEQTNANYFEDTITQSIISIKQ